MISTRSPIAWNIVRVATGTVGLRVGISAVILLAAFRPRLRRATAAQWRAVIPYGLVLGVI